ncbi:DUF4148 domain-containing protein [Rhodoferax sp.]|uniref:DUF4148 domain-containing protein n=1 Tax=Rhodoferax sp. TaxID=50421 RepID=UPI0025DADC53|nr:DUF4148 domain-containing protein [Rhodoferax sp.]
MTASKFAATALIALASVAATSAFAETNKNYPELVTTSAKTRAEVKTELVQARQNGSLNLLNDAQYPKIVSISTKTRAEVLAEYVAARKAGQIVQTHG